MRLVTVVDPWFGQYYRVEGIPPQADGTPITLTIGPLVRRVFRVEGIANKGDRSGTGNFKEKPCQHQYVEGLILSSEQYKDGAFNDTRLSRALSEEGDVSGPFKRPVANAPVDLAKDVVASIARTTQLNASASTHGGLSSPSMSSIVNKHDDAVVTDVSPNEYALLDDTMEDVCVVDGPSAEEIRSMFSVAVGKPGDPDYDAETAEKQSDAFDAWIKGLAKRFPFPQGYHFRIWNYQKQMWEVWDCKCDESTGEIEPTITFEQELSFVLKDGYSFPGIDIDTVEPPSIPGTTDFDINQVWELDSSPPNLIDASQTSRIRGDILVGLCNNSGFFNFEEPEMSLKHSYAWTQIVTETAKAVTVNFSLSYVPSADDVPLCQPIEVEIELTATRLEDYGTGNVSYGALMVAYARYDGAPLYDVTCSVCPNPYGEGTPTFTPDKVGLLMKLFSSLLTDVVNLKPDKVARDASIYDALENLQVYNLNLLENVPELFEIAALIKSVRSLIQVPKTPWKAVKWAANLHLFWKYVVKTTAMDVGEVGKLMRFIAKGRGSLANRLHFLDMIGNGDSKSKREAKGITYLDLYNTKVCYKPDISSIRGLDNLLSLLGVAPRLADLWDLVPYSFVVDWLLPIGDAIYNMERMNEQMRIPFVYMVQTRKTIAVVNRTFKLGGHTFVACLRIVNYNRCIRKKFPSDVWLGVGFQDPWRHLVTGGALLVQVLK